jgi:DNA repair protein RadC
MSFEHLPNITLLSRLVGPRAAKRLYRGTLAPLFLGTPDEPSKHHDRLAAARELVTRWLAEELATRTILKSPIQVRQFLQLLLADNDREVFLALFLDAQHRLIAAEPLFFGTIDGASVHPREVVRRVLSVKAAAVIFAHNHPSGVAEPSQADEIITQRLKSALDLIDVRTLDHFVVAGSKTTSLAERGLL